MNKVHKHFKKYGKSMEIPLFGGWLHAFYDREHYRTAVELCGLEVEDYEWFGGLCEHHADPSQGSMILIGIFEHEADIICHESVHAQQFILEYAGVDDAETEAYLTQKIFKFVFDNLPERNDGTD